MIGAEVRLAIAEIVPKVQRRQEEIDKAIENTKGLRKRIGKITLDELLSASPEGHITERVRARCLHRRVLGVRR